MSATRLGVSPLALLASQPAVQAAGAHAAAGTLLLPVDPLALLPGFALFAVIAWLPALYLLGRFSGWRRLADRYPASPPERSTRIHCGFVIIGHARYRNIMRLTVDERFMHVSAIWLFRAGHPTFSVPWQDIVASRDTYPWFPRFPVIRLTFANAPDVRFLVPEQVGERVIQAAGGRLRLEEPERVP